ncbi:AAA family ATPase, partial [Vulcanisaeta sp. JCM 16159]|uniref:AAA family ATPase n=1 Tax=Vulcanisaeta sp. JCM 16159 TaxID=1295371 RepID=UPI000AAA1B7A
LAIARELYGDAWRENTLELNASDERGITTIRERVKEFARTAPMGKAPYKLIILDEADNMTSDAQQALRRMMEMYANVTRFILIANYVSRIIDPIQSRCAMFRFSPLPRDSVLGRLREIASREGVKVTDEALEQYGT